MKSREMAGWFLGPKAENAEWEREIIHWILEDYIRWRRENFPGDEAVLGEQMRRDAEAFHQTLRGNVQKMLAHLRRDVPTYSPRYMGHMLSDQTLPSVLGYFAGLLYNSNNVTPESAPVTLRWELDAGADILGMLGYKAPPRDGKPSADEFGWAHITSGGTVANLEALWIARNVRYFPLAVHDVCRRHGIGLPVASLSLEQCLAIRPNDAIYLHAQLVDAVHRHWDLARSEAIRTAHELVSESKYSVAHHGTGAAYAVRSPVLVASGARHYSITKAADVLGVGRDNLVLVDVDRHFRMDVKDLEAKLTRIAETRRVPLAVIAVAGTTEEGAVDPVDRIAALRDRSEAKHGDTFWFHVDAAWGGYLRTIFTADSDFESARAFVSRSDLSWDNPDVFAALASFPRADSITVDPHKLGYIPYPCGVAAYRNDLVREFVTEEIPYISDAHLEDVDARRHRPPDSVGPYILEGSKPGSVVAALWLSHRMIPPNRDGYGRIIRESVLAAREFYQSMLQCSTPDYRLVPVTEEPPDTNIVCFFVQATGTRTLAETNALNRRLYETFTLEAARAPRFFLSRTILVPSSYSSSGIRALLDRAGIEPADYRLHGLFVFRATLMNPYYGIASESGHSYVAEFFGCLHDTTMAALGHDRHDV